MYEYWTQACILGIYIQKSHIKVVLNNIINDKLHIGSYDPNPNKDHEPHFWPCTHGRPWSYGRLCTDLVFLLGRQQELYDLLVFPSLMQPLYLLQGLRATQRVQLLPHLHCRRVQTEMIMLNKMSRFYTEIPYDDLTRLSKWFFKVQLQWRLPSVPSLTWGDILSSLAIRKVHLQTRGWAAFVTLHISLCSLQVFSCLQQERDNHKYEHCHTSSLPC